jgi:hypothetical protein
MSDLAFRELLDERNELRAKLAASEKHRAALELAVRYMLKGLRCEVAEAALTNHGGALAAHDARVREIASAEALGDYLVRQREFSERTFGGGRRTIGVTQHIAKELLEIREKPDDLTEWIDVIILAMDGYWRHGGQPKDLLRLIEDKLARNIARKWPTPTSEDEPVEHDRQAEQEAQRD